MNIIIETFGTVTMVLAIAGVVLNNRMDRRCFWLWIVSNAISCGLHCYIGLWSLAIRDAAFLVLAFDGLRRWRRNKAMRYLLDVQKSRNAAEFEKEFLGIPIFCDRKFPPMPKVKPCSLYKKRFGDIPIRCNFYLDESDIGNLKLRWKKVNDLKAERQTKYAVWSNIISAEEIVFAM